MTEKVEIIQLSPDRWKEYKELRLEMLLRDPQAFGQRYDKSINDPDSKWKDRLVASKKQDKMVMLFAEVEGKLIGTIGAFFNSDEETKNLARVFSVYVNENFRGLGIAKKLQEKLLSELKKIKDLTKVRVLVNKSQISAVKLYQQGNFQVIKTERMLLGDGKEYEVYTMEQDIH